ncbi:hypothetical protein AAFC00_000981 [Neodothiora populina]|uniref:SH3 domain-containing protein n=1 Tax=Neodothiora populina TaxID=2781224 RepID=A0ABR3PME0_9PEZI
MAPMEELQTAQINRSIRAIKAELEYLCDMSVISPQELSTLLSQVPSQTALHAPISVGAVPTAAPVVGAPQPPAAAAPTQAMHNLSVNEKQQQQQQQEYYQQPSPVASPAPPPAYGQPPPPAQPPHVGPPALAQATALYAYNGTDPGDLSLQPDEHIVVTEYMNAEWWKGRSSRTGQEGIFPRSYVRVTEDDKGVMMQQQQQQQQQQPTNYGNVPLEVSGQGDGSGKVPAKGAEMGKKFGKKLGNAAIFGAGATMGADIVNSIF